MEELLRSILLTLESILNRLESLTNTEYSSMLLSDWLKQWYKVYKVPKVGASGLRSIRNCIDLHILPNIQNKPLKELTSMDVQMCLNKIKTSRMAEYCHNVFTDSLGLAFKLEMIPKDLMLSVDKPKHTRNVGTALSMEEYTQYLSKIKHMRHFEIFLCYIFSGMRRSEALSLLWGDIDFEHSTILIRGTKTKSSYRVIPLFKPLRALFESIPHKSERVFPMSLSTLNRLHQQSIIVTGIDYHLHQLRHTCATRWYEKGVDMKIIQHWLGHSSINTTSKIYTHILSDFELSQIRLIDDTKRVVTAVSYNEMDIKKPQKN